MKLLLTTLAIVYLSLFMSLQAQEQVRVIPYPAEVTMQAETCKLKSGQKIHYLDASLYKEAAFLEKKLADLNYKMKVIPGKPFVGESIYIFYWAESVPDSSPFVVFILYEVKIKRFARTHDSRISFGQ